MTEETEIWSKIHNDLTELQSWENFVKVNVYELTSHLQILYSKIETLETQVKRIGQELQYQKEYAMEQNERYG
jgi:hypothetical protein